MAVVMNQRVQVQATVQSELGMSVYSVAIVFPPGILPFVAVLKMAVVDPKDDEFEDTDSDVEMEAPVEEEEDDEAYGTGEEEPPEEVEVEALRGVVFRVRQRVKLALPGFSSDPPNGLLLWARPEPLTANWKLGLCSSGRFRERSSPCTRFRFRPFGQQETAGIEQQLAGGSLEDSNQVWDEFIAQRERKAISLRDFDVGRSIGKAQRAQHG
eukprot:s2359_g4.t1